jgi:hypothetical protein
MDRELTEQKKTWLRRGLESLSRGEHWGGGTWIDTKTGKTKPRDEAIDPQFWLDQIEGLRVVSQCNCGEPNCHTVQFQNFKSGRVAGIVTYHTGDGRHLNILVNEDKGLLAELEII